ANTYTATTVVNDGTLNLNKTGVGAMSGPLTIGDGALSGNGSTGFGSSDVVRLLQSNQIPDFQGAVTINTTGQLDLNGNSDAIGTADGQTALTLTGGNVQMGSGGSLTVNGDIVFGNSTTMSGVTGTPTVAVAPQIGSQANPGSLTYTGSFQ